MMVNNKYRLVSSKFAYENFGIIRGGYSSPPSPQQIYNEGKRKLLNTISRLKDNSSFKTKLEEQLNTLSNFDKQVIDENTKVQMSLLEYLSQKVNGTVSKSLEIISKGQNLSLEEALSKKTKMGGFVQFSKVVEKMNRYLQNINIEENENIDDELTQDILNVLKSLQQLYGLENEKPWEILNIIQKQEEYWKQDKKGRKGLRKNRQETLVHLEILNALLSKDTALAAGQIAEKYVEFVTGALMETIDDQVENIIEESIQTGQKTGAKLMNYELARTYAPAAKKQVFFNNNGYYARFNMETQDKVDVEISTKSQQYKTIGLSVKNYNNPSQITLLQGNLLTILSQDKYAPYLYHFLNSYTYSIGETNFNPPKNLYILMKQISSVHALIGSQWAMRDKTLIQTSQADYLVVNDSSKEKGWKVYSSKEICDQLLFSDDNINKYISFSKEFNYPRVFGFHKLISDEKHRFTNIRVELRLKELSNTLT